MSLSRRDFLRLSTLAAVNATLFSVGIPGSSSVMAMTQAIGGAQYDSQQYDDLAFMPVEEQLRRFKAGTLSPVEVLEAQIARIEKYNGPLNTTGDEIRDFMNFNGMVNAITYEHFNEARKAAKESEERYRAGTARSLEGVTVAIKDENAVKGWRVTMGATPLKDAPLCEENAAIIDKLLAEGAVLHIQTTVPELYLHVQTWSKLWGVTRNPWNLHYGVGGSSGGSGAALAAGFTTLATGSDMGGSIRIPSAMCGVYGFKPPFGRVPTSDISFETLGPMARTFDDLVLMQNAIAGPHPTVHASIRPKLDYPRQYASLKGVKVALDYFGNWLEGGIDNSVRQALSTAAEVLRSQGAIVEEINLGWRWDTIYNTFFGGLLSSSMGAMLVAAKEFKYNATSYVTELMERMRTTGPVEMAQSDDLAASLHLQVQKTIFEAGYSALIMPSMLTTNFPADNDPATDSIYVNGVGNKALAVAPTYIWNMLSRYPVVNVPIGIASNNIPVGMQVIGNSFDDLAAFQVAYGYSQDGLRLYRDGVLPDYRNQA